MSCSEQSRDAAFMLRQACDVARQNIDFKVYQIAGAKVSPCRVRQSVGDYVHAEAEALDIVNGERHAVERHGAFRGDKAGQVGRRLKHESDAVAIDGGGKDSGTPVDMPGDEMAAQRITQGQG